MKQVRSLCGHSQGTTVRSGLLSTKPEYSRNIRTYAALTPVANSAHINTPIARLAHLSKEFSFVMNLWGVREIIPNSGIFKLFGRTLCRFTVSRKLCEAVINSFRNWSLRNATCTERPVEIQGKVLISMNYEDASRNVVPIVERREIKADS